jgi:hypothetical protein
LCNSRFGVELLDGSATRLGQASGQRGASAQSSTAGFRRNTQHLKICVLSFLWNFLDGSVTST